ncbi:MBL fold metallo-hydrolase [Clostridium sp.]|uniref:MBL fold metallo-hydrolase n=1 Tax=Clostridium sp. TaxID=1506 RepID=UPI0032178091
MIKVIATGSKGNAYVLQAGGEILLLELGIKFNDIKKALNFNLSNVVGALLTHEHKDHSKAFRDVLKSGIDIYTSIGTSRGIAEKSYIETYHRLHFVKSMEKFKVGGFTILPFTTEHDTLEPLGFLIHHPAIGKVLFATDTYYLKYVFNNVDHILIECNYSENVLTELPPYKTRILKSHMSLETLKDTLKTWDLKGTKDITLIHISEGNGDPEFFREEIEKSTGIKTMVAVPGLEID